MRRSRGEQPRLESLVTLSAAILPPGSVAVLVARHGPHLALRGQVSGTWQTLPTNPDTGGEQVLTGLGDVPTLGTVGAKATVITPGFIAQGQATGVVRITNRVGSIRVVLTGPPQPGFSGPPSGFMYAIEGGTGRYAGATGHGTADLVEGSGTFTMTFHPH